jgi:uncharacterized Zn finger protein (UPF0148 family)
MLHTTCPKCHGYLFIDDDGTSKAISCLNCGSRRELTGSLELYVPKGKTIPNFKNKSEVIEDE